MVRSCIRGCHEGQEPTAADCLSETIRRHGRALGKKSLQKLADVIAKTFAYTMATAECKKMVDLITTTRPGSMTDDFECEEL